MVWVLCLFGGGFCLVCFVFESENSLLVMHGASKCEHQIQVRGLVQSPHYYQAACASHFLPDFQKGGTRLTNNGYESKMVSLQTWGTYRMRGQHYSLQRCTKCLDTVKHSGKEMVLSR